MGGPKSSDDDFVMYRIADLPKITGGAITERQGRRYVAEKRLPVVKPAGPSGPAYIRRVDLARFIETHIVPAAR